MLWMTLENNRAPLLYYIKLCASFQSHGWFQTGLQSDNALFGSKSMFLFLCDLVRPSNLTQIGFESLIFQPVWSWNLMDDLEKQWRTSSILRLALCIISYLLISEFKLGLQSGNAQFGSKSAFFCPVWPWNLMDDLEKQQSTSSIHVLYALCIISKPSVNSNWSFSKEMTKFGSKSAICCRVWPWNLIDDLEKQ